MGHLILVILGLISLAAIGANPIAGGISFVIAVAADQVLWAIHDLRKSIESSRPSADELAEALRVAARKARTVHADGAVPSTRGER